MKSDNENLIIEYQNLRNEIEDAMKVESRLTIYACTAFITILGFAFVNGEVNANIFMLPFGVLIPISTRMALAKKSVAYLSSYMIVFLEDSVNLNWEFHNYNFRKDIIKGTKYNQKIVDFISKNFMLIFCAISIFLFWEEIYSLNKVIYISVVNAAYIVFQGAMLIFIWYINWSIRNVKYTMVTEWQSYKSTIEKNITIDPKT